MIAGRFLIPVYIVALLATLPARAQIVPPDGWTLSKSENGITMFSPCQGGQGAIGYTALPAWRITEPTVGKWFTNKSGSLIASWTGPHGRVLQRSGINTQGAIALEALTFDGGDGQTRTALLLGYPVGQVGQLLAVVAEGEVDEDNAQWQAAIEHIQGLIGRGYSLDPSVLTRRGDSLRPAVGAAGEVVARIGSSGLRYMPGRFAPTPRMFVLTRSGRFFEGDINAHRVQGAWKQVGNGFQLDFGDGTQDFVPPDCAEMATAGSDHTTPTAPPTPAPVVAPSPAQKRCHTETRYETQTQTVTRCWPNRGCGPETTQVQVARDVEVCN